MHPNDYDAHLGLALALRGQIDDSNYDKQVAAVQAELDACKKIDDDAARRLLQRGDPHAGVQGEERAAARTRPIAVYQQAKTIFQTFIDKAVGQARVRRRGEEGARSGCRTSTTPSPSSRPVAAEPTPAASLRRPRPAAQRRGSRRRAARPQRRPPAAARRRAGSLRRPGRSRLGGTVTSAGTFGALGAVSMSTATHRDAPVTLNPVDPRLQATYTYTVIPADISVCVSRSDAMKRIETRCCSEWLVAAVRFSLRRRRCRSRRTRARRAGGSRAATASGGNGDYGYKFDDDPLSAGGFGPNDATIRVRPGPVRTTLIRPRTSFVPEMLKSVENI